MFPCAWHLPARCTARSWHWSQVPGGMATRYAFLRLHGSSAGTGSRGRRKHALGYADDLHWPRNGSPYIYGCRALSWPAISPWRSRSSSRSRPGQAPPSVCTLGWAWWFSQWPPTCGSLRIEAMAFTCGSYVKRPNTVRCSQCLLPIRNRAVVVSIRTAVH
jgi:hypothetical protein